MVRNTHYITDLAFTDWSFDPDDVAATMIHEGVHAWQEYVASSHVFVLGLPGDVSSFDWLSKHEYGMERHASQYVRSQQESGRLEMSWLRRFAEIINYLDNILGSSYPFSIPAGVP